MRLTPLLVAVLAALFVTSAARAEPKLNGQRLAATCASCHGTNGAAAGGAVPGLAGQAQETLVSSMQAFKAGTRQATIMHQIAKGYTDEQIAAIATYLAAQKK
jgi:cytochrome c553